MEKLINTPGLQHIAEEIFFNLTSMTIDKCREVNESWKNILDNPSFWLRKCLQQGKLHKYKAEWKRTVQLKRLKHNAKNIDVTQHLKFLLNRPLLYNDTFEPSPVYWAAENGHADHSDIIRELAPLVAKWHVHMTSSKYWPTLLDRLPAALP